MAALEGRISADLNLGRHADLVPELTALVREYPYRETLRAHLMTALYHGDRRAEALAVYQDGRRILLEEVGVDPGATLVQTHLAVLRGQSRPEARRRAMLS
jgi:DNA-binding SARP family transcriptional activator